MLQLLCKCISANFQICVVFKMNDNKLFKEYMSGKFFFSVEIIVVSSLLLFLLLSAMPLHSFPSFSEDGLPKSSPRLRKGNTF